MKISQSFLGSKDGSKFWWLPRFPAQNNTYVNVCNTVYVFGVHITLLWSYQFSISKEGKYLLARWYWGLHVCSIKKQVSVFDDDTLFGLPKARPTYCQCSKLFKNGTFWQHITTGTRLGIFNLGGLNTPIYMSTPIWEVRLNKKSGLNHEHLNHENWLPNCPSASKGMQRLVTELDFLY